MNGSSRKFYGFQTTKTLAPGQFFGEIALLNQEPRMATVIAKSDLRLFVLLKSEFDLIVRQNSAFADILRHIVAEREFERQK